jgi:heptaprenyl diphosphate synthase
MKRSPGSTGESICPFAKPVLAENALYMAFHHEVHGKSAELIESIVLGYREPFKKSTPFHTSERRKKALLVIFPEIAETETTVLDVVHSNIKSQFVHDGLMVAQCHARCDGRSVHCPGLKVYTSPHPLIAMRCMALHDILFLAENESWFASYDQRFGSRFNRENAQLHTPKAFIVLRRDIAATSELARELQDFVKNRIAPYKYPRRIEFVDRGMGCEPEEISQKRRCGNHCARLVAFAGWQGVG